MNKCKSCFETEEVVPVLIREERGQPWTESTLRRCANDECWNMREGTREDRLKWIKNVYDYKYFGDYELSPEQLSAVYEAYAISTAPIPTPPSSKRVTDLIKENYELSKRLKKAREMEWQPIETAPNDGTKILAGCFKTNWNHEQYFGHVAVDSWDQKNGGWGRFNSMYWPATHWAPIPAPPSP